MVFKIWYAWSFLTNLPMPSHLRTSPALSFLPWNEFPATRSMSKDLAMRMPSTGLLTSGVLKLSVGLFSVTCVMIGVFKRIHRFLS